VESRDGITLSRDKGMVCNNDKKKIKNEQKN